VLALTFDPEIDLTRSGARHGQGCFETIRVQRGAARWLELHLERLADGCAVLGLDAPPEAGAVVAFLAPSLAGVERATLRLVAVDDRLLAAVSPPPSPVVAPVRVAVAEGMARSSRSPLARFKTLSYAENLLLVHEAERRGLFDVVAVNERGLLTDGGRTNVFLVVEGRVITPPVTDGALPGIARRVLLDQGLAREASVPPAMLATAEGLFLASALRGVLPVRSDAAGCVAACAGALG
jgi:branched-chain amino acid aminotransferase